MQPTFVAKPREIVRAWHIIDVQDVVLGRAASQIASILRGKHKPIFTPHTDTGDFVIVVNAEKIRLTGTKWDKKMYHYHTNFIGGIKSANAKTIHARHPTQLVEDAVRTMLRRSPLGRQMMSKLKVYAGSDHPHAAQKPQPYKLPY